MKIKIDKSNSSEQAVLHKLTTYAKQVYYEELYLIYCLQWKLAKVSRELNQTVLAKRVQDISDTQPPLELITTAQGDDLGP